MSLGKFESGLAWRDFVVLRMLRRWVAAKAAHARPLPSLVPLAAELDQPFETAVALDSLFQLIEGSLGRELRAECCCCPELVPDESAVLALIATAPEPLAGRASSRMPHGLPGVLCWAVAAVRAALGHSADELARQVPAKCPFEAAPEPGSAGL